MVIVTMYGCTELRSLAKVTARDIGNLNEIYLLQWGEKVKLT